MCNRRLDEVSNKRKVPPRQVSLYETYIKRGLDVLLSGTALFLLSPVFLLVSFLIYIDGFEPVFFKQKRIGKNGVVFEVLKFRTMVMGAEKYQRPGEEVIGRDKRITRIGYPLRRFKIDELPQLINILKGDMSIVGPRPSLPEYLNLYEEWEMERFSVKPGLSGLAQVNGNIYLSRMEKSRFDVAYVRRLTFCMDIKIVLKTIVVILMGEERFRK